MTLPAPQRQPGFRNVCVSLCLGLDGGRHRPRRYTWLLPLGGADVPRHGHPNQLRRDLAAGHEHWPGAHHQVHPPRQGPLCPLRPHCGDGAPQPRHHCYPRAAQRSGLLRSSLLESLSTRLPSNHARIHSHYMAAHPVDAEPPTTLRFASTKPKPATFAKKGWHKEAAKRKLFLFDPRQSGEETLRIYSLSGRSAWEWDGDGPGLTVPSAYLASGLLALPVTSTPLFVAHEDPLLELPSDCPTAVNSDPSQLASRQHLFIRGFFAEYEVEEAHKEALAMAEERWARIFNHNRPVASRAEDPPDCKMVWGKPEDMSKHPDGEEHIKLWDLPRLTAVVTRVKAKLEAILGQTLHVMTQGYIESITHVRQLLHRDFPLATLPADGIALSVFWALSMDIRDDEVCAQFVAMSARAFPRPWIIHCMPMRRGSLRVICSTVVHEGGGLPLAAEPGSRRIIGFCGLSTHTVSYATTHAITPPFWAHKPAVSCGVHGCRRKPTSEKCFGCGVQVLCRNHTGIECSKCDTEAASAATSDPGSA